MNPVRWFRKRRPVPAPAMVHVSSQDRVIAAHAGFTPEQWAGLSVLAKVDHREEFYAARGLAG